MKNEHTRQAMVQSLHDNKVREKLEQMEKDDQFNTRASSYSANSTLYPNNQIPFVEKHLSYLMSHPGVDCDHYLSNLRLMLKVRG